MVIRKKINISQIIIHIIFVITSILFMIPLWSIISVSISSETDIVNYGYSLIPRHIDWAAYTHLFTQPLLILQAYKVTALVAVIGTILGVLMDSMCAYALARRDFAYRSYIAIYLFFTMLFSGGLVPTYILMTNYLHLQNTYAALIIPGLGGIWFLILMRTFFLQLPTELIQSAMIDGANEFLIYIRIIVPLSTPIMATISLFQILQYWNEWMPVLLYVSDKDMYTLQYLLQSILRNLDEIYQVMSNGGIVDPSQLADAPKESLRMAMVVVAAGPMLVIFPFFQKYFAKGITVGSLK